MQPGHFGDMHLRGIARCRTRRHYCSRTCTSSLFCRARDPIHLALPREGHERAQMLPYRRPRLTSTLDPTLHPRPPLQRLPQRLQQLCRWHSQSTRPLRDPRPRPSLHLREDCQQVLAGHVQPDRSLHLASRLAECRHALRLGLFMPVHAGRIHADAI